MNKNKKIIVAFIVTLIIIFTLIGILLLYENAHNKQLEKEREEWFHSLDNSSHSKYITVSQSIDNMVKENPDKKLVVTKKENKDSTTYVYEFVNK